MIPGTSVAAEESAACTNGSAASLTLLWPRVLSPGAQHNASRSTFRALAVCSAGKLCALAWT
eukprot:2961327-Karenia_brevis.AAC.1